jgi:hypothetical protein
MWRTKMGCFEHLGTWDRVVKLQKNVEEESGQ